MEDNQELIVEMDYSPSVSPSTQAATAQQVDSQINMIARISELSLARPRNEKEALRKTMEAVDESSVWSVPNRGTGLSVNIIRTAVRNMTNIAVIPRQFDVMLNTDSGTVPGWYFEVLAIDMENRNIQVSTGSTPKPRRKPNEKDLAFDQRCFQASLAFLGRLERNAAAKLLPGEWKDKILSKYQEKVKNKPLRTRLAEAAQTSKAIGVTREMVEQLYQVAANDLTETDWADWNGRLNAVTKNELTREQAFPELFNEDGTPRSAVAERVQAQSGQTKQADAKSEEPAPETLKMEDVTKDEAFAALQPQALFNEMSDNALKKRIKDDGVQGAVDSFGVDHAEFLAQVAKGRAS